MKISIIKHGLLLLGSFTLVSMSLIKMDLQDAWEVPAAYENMKNPYQNVADEDRVGRVLYSKHCKFCHGAKGKGDGNQAKLLQTPVADFTSETFKNQSDGGIYYKLYTGRNEMPGFEKIIKDEEDFWMVINYIKAF